MIGARKAALKQPVRNYDPESYVSFYTSASNDSRIRLPLVVEIDRQSFSVECKVRLLTDKADDHTFLGQNDPPYADLQTLHIVARGMSPHFGFYGNDFSAGDDLALNTWYRLVFVHDHNDPKRKLIYVNGSLVGSSGSGEFIGTQRLVIGQWQFGRQLEGDMMYFRLWDKALTQTEITAYDDRKIAHAIPDLKIAYTFSGDATDYSGNGYNGNLDNVTFH